MGDSASLLTGLLFGSIGVGYCIYGKKQRHLVAFLSGISLIGLPYIIDNVSMLIVLSLVIMIMPKLIKL